MEPTIFKDLVAVDGFTGIAVKTAEECAEWDRREAEKARTKALNAYLETLPDDYRETTDMRLTDGHRLLELFELNKACGAIEFPVNAAAFKSAMRATASSLYLYGETGTGKTRAALRLAFHRLNAGAVPGVLYVRFSAVTARYSAGPSPELPFDPQTRRLLILDDFLNAKPIGARKEAFAGELLTLIEDRLMNGLPTIFTANRAPGGVCDWFDACGVDSPSVVRRIGQKCAVISF